MHLEVCTLNLEAKQVRGCLDEIQSELFNAADDEECQRFHKDTQLTATLLLLARMLSLIRPLLLLQESGDYDAFDGVLRAFEETWYLGHEFRLAARKDRAIAWLAGQDNTWKAKIGALIEFAKGRGHNAPTMGADYNLLSELAHPTRTAAENSLAICMVRHGIDGAIQQLAEQPKMKGERIRYALYRLVWLMTDEDDKFIKIPADIKKMPECERFIAEYDHIDPAT
jgi:hypothetical protein